MPNPTPGQVAYAAYVRVHFGVYGLLADWQYGRLSEREQATWEAAAQAVLAQWTPPEPAVLLCRWCGQPLAAHPHEGEPWRCKLSDGPLLPTEAEHA